SLPQLHPRIIPRPAGIDRLLSLPADRCVDSPRAVDCRRRPRRDLSVMARRVATDRHDVARRSSGMSETPVIAALGLKRAYHMGEELVHAVRGVTLDVACGDYVAIVGPSGCGKSTLLNLLGGIDRPSAGTVSIDGSRIDHMSDREATRFR